MSHLLAIRLILFIQGAQLKLNCQTAAKCFSGTPRTLQLTEINLFSDTSLLLTALQLSLISHCESSPGKSGHCNLYREWSHPPGVPERPAFHLTLFPIHFSLLEAAKTNLPVRARTSTCEKVDFVVFGFFNRLPPVRQARKCNLHVFFQRASLEGFDAKLID